MTTAKTDHYTWKMNPDEENEQAFIFKSNAVGVLEYTTTVPYHDKTSRQAAKVMFNALKTANV